MLMLDVRKLRLLRELSHRGTIAAVADALTYTPSAVSQQLSALEREAGVSLLERSGRRVTLTPAAVALVAHTESILASLQAASADLVSMTSALTGTLRIGVFPSAVSALLRPALVGLSTEHPGLHLMASEIDPATVPDALRGGTLDIALLQEYDHVPLDAGSGLEIEPLLTETVHLAALTSGPIAAHRGSAWIAGTPGTLCHVLTLRTCEAAGFTPGIRHHTDDFGAVLALVDAGQGVALVPDLGVRGDTEAVLFTPLEIRRRTFVAYRRGMGAHPAVTAARQALQAAAARVGQSPDPTS